MFSPFRKAVAAGEQSFPRAEQLKFVAKSVIGVCAGEFSGLKFAGRKIDEGKADG